MADINIGQFAEALNNKTDRDMKNVDTVSGGDAVIAYQVPTAENNYTWYRKYKSGWVEQGGCVVSTSTDYGMQEVVFPVEMATAGHYFVSITPESSYNNTMEAKGYSFSHPTKTGMRVYPQTSTLTYGNYWMVCGMADLTQI